MQAHATRGTGGRQYDRDSRSAGYERAVRGRSGEAAVDGRDGACARKRLDGGVRYPVDHTAASRAERKRGTQVNGDETT